MPYINAVKHRGLVSRHLYRVFKVFSGKEVKDVRWFWGLNGIALYCVMVRDKEGNIEIDEETRGTRLKRHIGFVRIKREIRTRDNCK